MNSTACVGAVRRALGVKKAGHLGTLDSLGAGVLPIAVGKATRIFDFYLKKRKTYRAIFRFGVQTDTLDPDGQIKQQNKIITSKSEVLANLAHLSGQIEQAPPFFSAKKIAGKRASDLVREGIEVELKSSKVTIFKFELLEELEQNLFLFEIECSAGTYIRSLCRDLAMLCNTCATMVCIIRTDCGIFNIAQTNTLEEIKSQNFCLIPTHQALEEPQIVISALQHKNILDGKQEQVLVADGIYQLMFESKLFVLAEIKNTKVKVITFFGE